MIKNTVTQFLNLLKNDVRFADVQVIEEFPADRVLDKYPAITISSANLQKTKPFSENSGIEICIKIMTQADKGGLYLESMIDDVVRAIMGSGLMADVASISSSRLNYNSSNETINQTLTVKTGVIDENAPTLLPLQFWNMTWTVNPESIRIRQGKNLRENNAPFGTSNMQNLGNNARIISGDGEFYGAVALAEFLTISNVQRNNQSHPLRLFGIFAPMNAFFTRFELNGALSPTAAKYSFEFVEDVNRGMWEVPNNPDQWTHTVQPGETIFSIARLHGLSIEHLVRSNGAMVDFANLRPGVTVWLQ